MRVLVRLLMQRTYGAHILTHSDKKKARYAHAFLPAVISASGISPVALPVLPANRGYTP
jgi:hypothetical protein